MLLARDAGLLFSLLWDGTRRQLGRRFVGSLHKTIHDSDRDEAGDDPDHDVVGRGLFHRMPLVHGGAPWVGMTWLFSQMLRFQGEKSELLRAALPWA